MTSPTPKGIAKHGQYKVGHCPCDREDCAVARRELNRRLAEQWPKRCSCGASYTVSQWEKLKLDYQHTDAYATSEARRCTGILQRNGETCNSTLVVYIEIHDLSEDVPL